MSSSVKGDIRDRLFAHFADRQPDQTVVVDIPLLLERILLFDKYIIHSQRLRDIPPLVDAFGFDAVMELLQSGAVEIHDDVLTIGSRTLQGPSRLPSFEFLPWRLVHDACLDNDLAWLRQNLNLESVKVRSLEAQLRRMVTKYPEQGGTELYESFAEDLKRNCPQIKQALLIKLKEVLNKEIKSESVEIGVTAIREHHFVVESNIMHLFDLTKEAASEIAVSALLAISGMNRRILEMKTYTAMSGYSELEIPIFDSKE
jgi:hypothetical protein